MAAEEIQFRFAWPPRVQVSDEVRMAWLSVFLRLLSVGYIAAFIPWITLILVDADIMAPGGRLAPLLRFQPYNADYESMLVAIHIVWAIMLWRAAGDPAKHALFIDFTIWATAAHGFVMIIATPVQKGLIMTFIEGLPLFVIAATLWWLRPRVSSPTPYELNTRVHGPPSWVPMVGKAKQGGPYENQRRTG